MPTDEFIDIFPEFGNDEDISEMAFEYYTREEAQIGSGHDFIENYILGDRSITSYRVPKKTYKIGAITNNGVIKEYESDKIFIPTSGNCCYKIIKKINPEYKIPYDSNPNGISLIKFRKELNDQGIDFEITKEKENEIKQVSYSKRTDKTNRIYLHEIDEGYFHAILIKDSENTTIKYIKKNIEISNDYNLEKNNVKIEANLEVENIEKFVVYDIETSGKNPMIPQGLSYAEIDMNKKWEEQKPVETIVGKNCLNDFLENISKKYKKVKIFAHNGGRFDHIFIKGLKDIKFKHQIKSGSLKSLEIEKNGSSLIFLDSYLFMKNSLKDIGKIFKKYQKTEFDIADKDDNFFQQTTEWIEYMKNDSSVLAYGLYQFELMLREMGLTLNKGVGLPSLAWHYLIKNTDLIEEVKRIKDPSAFKLAKDSVYGGRIIHNKRYSNEELICLDGNSLYPSAMKIGNYPIGNYQIITNFEKQKNFMFIAEFEMDGNNMRYPLTPSKSENGLRYRANKWKGVYNSVDYGEFIKQGGTAKFIQGIYWINSKKIFENLIDDLYNKRLEYKEQKNPIEYVYKILLNSLYGKFLESIDTTTSFSDKPSGTSKKLNNGQYENRTSFLTPFSSKPNYYGSFILAYSRKIMNEMILKIGPENIYYGDTDSLYIPRNKLGSIELKDGLGHFKNDYDDKYIKEAFFLDQKRYMLVFNDGKVKIKFVGIRFGKFDYIYTESDEDIKMFKDFYNNQEHIAQKVQEKWFRKMDHVVIKEKDIRITISPDKKKIWKDDEAYPLDFDFTKPENNQVKVVPDYEKFNYDRIKKELKTDKPLYYPDGETLKVGMDSKLITSFFVYENEIIIERNNGFYRIDGPEAVESFTSIEKLIVAGKEVKRIDDLGLISKECYTRLKRIQYINSV